MSRTKAQWERIPARIPQTHYIDNSIYVSQEIFDKEMEEIFKKVWRFVCHESEVPNAYDFRTTDVAGVPLVIVRGKDGKIRTFLNSCSHRGAVVVREPAGNAKAFRCLFHLWTYDTLGNCLSMTRGEGYEAHGCSKEDFGLREVRTRTHLGLVFVSLDDDGESFEDFFGNAFEDVEQILGTKPLEVFHFHSCVLKTNWKNWNELNVEIYHEYLHSLNRLTSLGQPGYHDREWKFYPHGHRVLQGPLLVDYTKYKGWKQRDGEPLPGLKVRDIKNWNLWPDFLMVARATCIRFDCMVPLSPTETYVEFRGLGIKGESPEQRAIRISDHNQVWGPFGRNLPEDNAASEAQTPTMKSGLTPYSLMAREEGSKPQTEETLRHFYREWEIRMGRSASSVNQSPPQTQLLQTA